MSALDKIVADSKPAHINFDFLLTNNFIYLSPHLILNILNLKIRELVNVVGLYYFDYISGVILTCRQNGFLFPKTGVNYSVFLIKL